MLIFLAALCGLIEAMFTALEVALGTVSRARLRSLSIPSRDGDADSPALARRAVVALSVAEEPAELALLFITVTSLSLWAAATLLTWGAISQNWAPWVLPVALGVLLFVAEVLPLQIAARHAEAIALRGAGLVLLALKILSPITGIVGGIAYGVARAMGSGPNASPQVTQGELRTALAAAEEEGVIESEERALIEGAMDFRDKIVSEVMTPRIDIVGIPADATLPETLEMALREGHSRLPIFDGTLDKIIGILATKDLLPHLKNALESQNSSHKVARDVARPAYFVPENKKIASTLEELRRQRTLLAVVVDSDGGTAGLVTLEDLLEELVGEIQDEYDLEEPPLRAAPGEEATLLCDAATPVREFGKFWHRSFGFVATLRGFDGAPAPSSQSLASLSLELFQNVPQIGDQIRAGDALAATSDIRADFALWMEVTKMEGPRIEEVKIAARGA
ncbi:CBS domain pair family protein [Abditibacterium utsteinense]|uniref:CBS domain pair family protein n=1 Tax=Abditibacterium utsteinense TaxID=1960156 RepID=A0A2S8STD9_9BACT|nr:hemolysin family protein [Abditibacterium utsteinense]PQV64065.1 CBS domain pair family protein [Abditibacterium utsteinense]